MSKKLDYRENNCKCKKCEENFIYYPEDTFWDEKGMGYSTKLTKCPYCNTINVLKYIEDRAMKLNVDSRYYE